MSGVRKWHLSINLEGATKVYEVVLASDYDPAQSELAALREELAAVSQVNTQLAGQIESDRNEHAIAVEAMQQRLTAAEQRNASLLEVSRGLTIQLHATIGNTELHDDCVRDLAALEAVDAKD